MAEITPHAPNTFGELLRHLRQRARLTQDELGLAVGYSRAHVARLEGNQRAPDVAAVQARFSEALLLQDSSEAAQRLVELAMAARETSPLDVTSMPVYEPELPSPAKPALNNLPAPLTSFVGRTRELGELNPLWPTTRLMTLTGAGGAGKTRLALALAADAVNAYAYADGVWLAELASLADPVALPQMLLAVLGLHEEPNRPALTTLLDGLRSKQMLLVLDNCEHLIEACAQLAEAVLRNSPAVRILTTSREALGIGGELAWRVPSLQTPLPTATLAPAELEHYEAVQLFIARAALAAPGFVLTATHALAVQQICAQLDGMPLAIELAAARIKVLSPQDISARLSDRFRLLTQGSRTALPRHQTLRAVIDWSYLLLTEAERVMFRRLSVFVGSWTMEAAEAVCQSDSIAMHDILDLLARLVDKSLVVMSEHDGVTRYQMLETIRQYGAEKLVELGEGAAVRDRHLDYFLNWGEHVGPQLGELDLIEQVPVLKRTELDLDNIRYALDWAVEAGPIAKGLRLIVAIANLFIARAGFKEMLSRSQVMVDNAAASRDTHTQVAAYLLMARLYFRQSELGSALKILDRAEAEAVSLTDLNLRAEILRHRAQQGVETGDFVLARLYIDKWRDFYLSNNLLGLSRELYMEMEAMIEGWFLLDTEDYPRAITCLTSLQDLVKQRGNKPGIVGSTAVSRMLGYSLLNSGRFNEAVGQFHASLVGNLALGDLLAIAACFAAWAAYAMSQEDFHAAAHLFGMSQAIEEAKHTPFVTTDNRQVQRNLFVLRQLLDPAELAANWAAGRTMTLEQAVDFALSLRPPDND